MDEQKYKLQRLNINTYNGATDDPPEESWRDTNISGTAKELLDKILVLINTDSLQTATFYYRLSKTE